MMEKESCLYRDAYINIICERGREIKVAND